MNRYLLSYSLLVTFGITYSAHSQNSAAQQNRYLTSNEITMVKDYSIRNQYACGKLKDIQMPDPKKSVFNKDEYRKDLVALADCLFLDGTKVFLKASCSPEESKRKLNRSLTSTCSSAYIAELEADRKARDAQMLALQEQQRLQQTQLAQMQMQAQALTQAQAQRQNQQTTSTSQVSFGPCPPEGCTGFKTPYTWGVPGPLMGVYMDMYPYIGGGDFNNYEQPKAKCDESNAGEIMAVDFGNEVRPVVCMGGPNINMQELAKKLKEAKVDKLPTETARYKAKYTWEKFKPGPPVAEGEMRFCSAPSTVCEQANLLAEFGAAPCDILKCIRTDRGEVKSSRSTASTKPETTATTGLNATTQNQNDNTSTSATSTGASNSAQPSGSEPYIDSNIGAGAAGGSE